jgi:hypothetical protein
MPPPPKKKDKDHAIAIAKVTFIHPKTIEQAMNDVEKNATGLGKLTATELANLNEFITSAVLAPGDQPQ